MPPNCSKHSRATGSPPHTHTWEVPHEDLLSRRHPAEGKPDMQVQRRGVARASPCAFPASEAPCDGAPEIEDLALQTDSVIETLTAAIVPSSNLPITSPKLRFAVEQWIEDPDLLMKITQLPHQNRRKLRTSSGSWMEGRWVSILTLYS